MKNLKKYKTLLLTVGCFFLFSTNAFAATQSSNDSCIQHKSIVVSVDGSKETIITEPISGIIKTTRATVCCEPNSPKTRVRMYEHYYYNPIRCDWRSTDYNKCSWCGALSYISSTSLTTHLPGAGYYCPY